jgi:acetyl-CoA carboxylase biotin carboxylase subunit
MKAAPVQLLLSLRTDRRMPAIKKILVANRGEIAVRIMRTCKEMDIRTVAVFSEADRLMPHVLMADEAYLLGPPPSRESYLRVDRILDVARSCGADAIHPGYGFLSENEDFAEAVTRAGLIFIGPSASSIRAMGDKTEARRIVSRAGVPIVPGTAESVETAEAAEEFCRAHGFPVLIKAAAGGGGKGMRIVRRKEDLVSLLGAARSEARSSFGDGRVYLEKYLEGPRHIEFQILADNHGNVIHLGERECSIQRRHQKVIEETPSVIVDDRMREAMGETAVNAARACAYVNAGTIEFLVDRHRHFYFLEMNTRLQVEHPVTEMRTGVDLVASQIRIAMGEPLGMRQQDVHFRGHAIECRIYAEDPKNNYLPSTGIVRHLRPSQGFGIRDDRGIEQGNEISVYYDPLVSKLVVWGQTREETRRRMIRALTEYEVLGVETNIPLNLAVLQHPRFIEGTFDTHFLEDERIAALRPDIESCEMMAASAVAALMFHQETEKNGNAPLASSVTAGGNRWSDQRREILRNRWRE